MLSPEVWNFKSPQHHNFIETKDHKKANIPDAVTSHYFNHSVSLVLPDTIRIPDKLRTCLSEDTDYYRINGLNVYELINKEFIEAFVKKGELTLLTIGNKIDLDNLIAITPTGHLILSLLTEDFQKLGLEGTVSFFDRKVHTRYVDMCPYITSLCILRDERIVDLTILATLDYLKELKLLSCDFYAHGIKTLLEIKGRTIMNLHLEHIDEIDLNALMDISQYCPNIKNLVFYNCEFLEHAPIHSRKLAVPPFEFLERIKCVVDCANMHLEFLLSHCANIKFIQLGSSTGIGDETMRKIFLKNSMKKLEELKILYSHDLSMKTVQLLMQNCDNLRRLSELESWEGISPTELSIFRDELKCTNTNLDTSPSLSFA